VRESKPSLESGLNGAWLIAVVATQSLAVLGALLGPRLTDSHQTVLFVALCAFLCVCMFYLLIINLIFYRFTFFRLAPEDLSPPYWINMGAVAITTMAGATLILNSAGWALLEELRPFLKGFTLFFWATATWWIPLLLILGVWRHAIRRVPLRYQPQYWGMVFPLGMYTACTYQLGRATDLPLLSAVSRGLIYVALAAWVVVFVAMLLEMYRALITRPREAA
jgi:tellurite resistance protein TehA-like permease